MRQLEQFLARRGACQSHGFLRTDREHRGIAEFRGAGHSDGTRQHGSGIGWRPGAGAPASVNSSSCAKYAATHMFAQVTAVKANADGSLTVTAHHASVVCGGLDDLHYNIATVTETGTVTPAGTVRMLAGASQEQTVAHADVSSGLATDNWGRIFMVQGPLTAITALTEMYHP